MFHTPVFHAPVRVFRWNIATVFGREKLERCVYAMGLQVLAFDTIHERDVQQTDRLTPHDSIGRAYAGIAGKIQQQFYFHHLTLFGIRLGL